MVKRLDNISTSHNSSVPETGMPIPGLKKRLSWLDILPRLDRRATALIALASTAVLSVLGTVEANSPNNTKPEPAATMRIDGPVGSYAELSVGRQDVRPGSPIFRLPGFRANFYGTSGQPEIQTPETNDDAPQETEVTIIYQRMAWARLFDKDPKAGESIDGDKALQDTLDAIKMFEDRGIPILSIEYEGSSSSEAVTKQAGDGRLNDYDEQNVLLAIVRRDEEMARHKDAITNTFSAAMADKMIAGEGKEQKDPILNQAIYYLAGQKGVDADTLLNDYNKNLNNIQLSDDERKILDELAAQRYVKITITTQKVNQWNEGDGGQQKDTSGVSFVIIPMILPIPRRRSKDDGVSQIGNGPSPDPEKDRIGSESSRMIVHSIGRVGLAREFTSKEFGGARGFSSRQLGVARPLGPSRAIGGVKLGTSSWAASLIERIPSRDNAEALQKWGDMIAEEMAKSGSTLDATTLDLGLVETALTTPARPPLPAPVRPSLPTKPRNTGPIRTGFLEPKSTTMPGHSSIAHNHKQPGRPNDGGNHGSRGQTNRL